MSAELRIAPGFALPLTFVTEVVAILATRGAGKSYGSASVIEEMFAASLQFVVIDPMGVYWGLRSGKEGSQRGGLPIFVLGGERGDVPLEPTSGKLIADVVVDSGGSFVLDLSDFDSKAQQTRFVTDFAERLFTRKSPLEARTPLMLVIDEADEFAPQKPQTDEARMLGAIIRLAKRGRSRGIGMLSITQRSAEFSKAVLDLSSAVLFMRTSGPRDRKVIREWFKGQNEALMELPDTTLPRLDTGEAIIYSPHWLGLDEPKRIKFRRIATFDSYRTPEPGETRPQPREAAKIDLDALGEQIKATVEKAKESDPQALREQIAELRRELAKRPSEAAPVEVERVVEVPVLTDAERDMLKQIAKAVDGWGEQAQSVTQAATDLTAAINGRVRSAKPPAPAPTLPPPLARAARQPAPDRNGDERLNRRAERVVLAVLAQYPQGRTKKQVAIIGGYATKGGGFNGALSKLRTLGYIVGKEVLTITQEGLEAIEGQWEQLPSGRALLDHWLSQMNRAAERAVLQALYDAFPNSLTKEQIAERTGYEPLGGGFNGALSKLRTLELIEGYGEIRASEVLFEGVPA